MARCVLRRIANGKFRFRTNKGKTKCTPGKSASASHAKKFGYSGSMQHKRHAYRVYKRRLGYLAKARMARKGRKM